MRKDNWIGFADVYLRKTLDRCDKESKTGDKIEAKLYSKLVKLDARLGTKASEQLYMCLVRTTRSDIIKVLIVALNLISKIISDN